MNIGKRGLTIAIVVSLIAVLSVGQLDAVGLLAISVGTLLLILGVWLSYRPASIFGFMTFAIGSGLAVDSTSLTDITYIMGASVGILIPVYLTGWAALSSEVEGGIAIKVRNRATLLTIGYTVVCAFSVPVAALVVGIFAPNMATHITIISEAAILLLVIALWVIAVAMRAPKPPPSEAGAGEAAAEKA